ncbi:Inner membrane metabolite transport protein YhjE [Arthrobacter ulcerisalmonis]|uniref:Inner membrane metabolite transport protein YhjE n=1 Tax=Arthrobacter ulcerisalmonis TaxID=2483813 RepID=A0A3P5WTG5_9MICC|nr:MFS transporter [Arthrobacter ulcerisalmonis]VDC18435.1 Inner membrane metabolite transport protein YhjE [Arthrobacter ulcerisalmonis]
MASQPAPKTEPIVVERKDMYKAFAASLTGTALEFYDFAVYSAAAAIVFPLIFFPAADPLTGTLLAFSTYAVGYISRPVGGIIFGRLGDEIGRKKVLVITLLLIGVATFLIGLLPTYGNIGIVAPIALVLLRFAQGVGVGGEWGSAVLLSSEFGDPRRRGFWASAAQIGPPAGNLMANGALAILTLVLSEEAFLSYGWRIAFLISAVLVAFGLWIRLRLEDTPVFRALEARGDKASAPIREVLQTQRRPLAAAILSRIGPDVLYALCTVFTLTYGIQKLGFDRGQVLVAVLIGSAVQLFTMPLAGALSDRINRRLVYGVAAVGASIWAFVFFIALDGKSSVVLIIGTVMGLVFHSFMYGPQAAFVVEQFSPRLRSTGSSLAYTFAGIIGGAIAPFMFTLLMGAYNSWLPVAIYLTVACILTLIGLALGRNSNVAEDEEYLQVSASA